MFSNNGFLNVCAMVYSLVCTIVNYASQYMALYGHIYYMQGYIIMYCTPIQLWRCIHITALQHDAHI